MLSNQHWVWIYYLLPLQKSSSQNEKADFPGKLHILYFTSLNVLCSLKTGYLQNQHGTLAYRLLSVPHSDVQTQGRSWSLCNCWLLWCITEKHFPLHALETTPDWKITQHDVLFKQASKKPIGFLYQHYNEENILENHDLSCCSNCFC